MLETLANPSQATALAEQILSEITTEKCVELIKSLVPTGQPGCGNSIDPEAPMAHEEDISKQVGKLLQSYGLDVEWVAAIEGRPNVVGRWNDGLPGPSLIFNDHLDTYPSCDPKEWHMSGHNPYNATLRGKYLYGRGTSDTRGNMTCQLIAIEMLRQAGVKINGELSGAFNLKRGVRQGCPLSMTLYTIYTPIKGSIENPSLLGPTIYPSSSSIVMEKMYCFDVVEAFIMEKCNLS